MLDREGSMLVLMFSILALLLFSHALTKFNFGKKFISSMSGMINIIFSVFPHSWHVSFDYWQPNWWKGGKAAYLNNIVVAFGCSDFDSKVDKKKSKNVS
jgi:hypothetical protein